MRRLNDVQREPGRAPVAAPPPVAPLQRPLPRIDVAQRTSQLQLMGYPAQQARFAAEATATLEEALDLLNSL